SLASKRATVVLPLPLSPTKAVARPGRRASEASSTACTACEGLKSLSECKGTSLCRCTASRTGSSFRMGSSLVDVAVLVDISRLQTFGWTFRVQFCIIEVASNTGSLPPSRWRHLGPFSCYRKQGRHDSTTGCEGESTSWMKRTAWWY